MISHVCTFLLAYGGKGSILHTLCHAHKMGVRPFGLSDWLYACYSFCILFNKLD